MLFEWQLTGLKHRFKVKLLSYKARLNPFLRKNESARNVFELEFEQRKNKERYERKKHSIFLIICKMGFLSNFVAVYYMLKQLRIR